MTPYWSVLVLDQQSTTNDGRTYRDECPTVVGRSPSQKAPTLQVRSASRDKQETDHATVKENRVTVGKTQKQQIEPVVTDTHNETGARIVE